MLSFSGGVNPEGELPIEGTVQFNAFVRMSDGGGESVTARVSSWQSANTNVATVSSSGLVRGVGPGLTAITAEYEGLSGTLNLLLGR